MKKPRVVDPLAEDESQGVVANSGLPATASSISCKPRLNAKARTAVTAVPALDLQGFDLTEFARFLRETDPAWVAGTEKLPLADRCLKP
jgi:hypothetical protein